jgi:predicted Zn-dependent protease
MRRVSVVSRLLPLQRGLAALFATLLLVIGAKAESPSAMLAKARELARAGQAAEAADTYQQLYDATPDDLSLRFQLAVTRHMAGQFDAAVEHSRAVAAQRPEFPPAWLFLGAGLLRGGRAAEAVEPLRWALSLGVADASAPLMLGEALLQAGEHGEAALQFLSASATLKDNPRVWYGLDRACAALIERLGETAEPQPPAADCESAPLSCAHREGRFAEVLSASGGDRATRYWQARTASELSRLARKRLAALPPSSQYFELLARDLDARGMSREAAVQWRRALELAPGSRSAKMGLAAALRLARDCESALPLIEDLQAEEPESGELHFLEGDCLLMLERAREAIKPLTRALELDGSLLQASGRLGEAYVKLGKHELAVEPLKRALPADEDGSFHYSLARVYRTFGRDEEARAIIEEYRRVREEAAARRPQTP